MNHKRRRIALAVFLMLSIGSFSRLKGNENIRAVQFLSIFAIGAISSLLIREVAETIKKKNQQSEGL